MIGDVLELGDKVSITIEKENREWGYDPCPDGTVAEVVGFSETFYSRTGNFGHKPGVYETKSWVLVRSEDKEWREWSGRFTMLDAVEYERRVKEWRANGAPFVGAYLRELPETEFWEGDVVASAEHPDVRVVQGINYNWMGDKAYDGSPLGFYQCSSDLYAGWHVTLSPKHLTLVERGPVWRYFHGVPLNLDTEAEAKLHNLLGLVDEVRNPATDLYKWTLDEALEALRDGLGHAIRGGTSFLSMEPRTSVVRYQDEALGERVAAMTLANF